MSTQRAAEILRALEAQESSDTIDRAEVDRLLQELRNLDTRAVATAAGLPEEEEEEALEAPGVWRNWPRNLKSTGVHFETPGNATELVEAVQGAIDSGQPLKPLGASYSCSEASQPENGGWAIDTRSRLNGLLPIDDARTGVPTTHLVRAQSGIRLIDLAEQLAEDGLALSNMGGFAKQTLAGVLSTGTHGTGLNHSTFSDMVVSVDVVIVDGSGKAALHRFEPTGGITDPNAFDGDPDQLHQGDDAFYAMVVHCGMVGIAYAYTLRVVDLYWVVERNESFVWPDDYASVLADAKAGADVSITIHPYPTLPGGKHRGLVNRFTRLSKAQVDADPDLDWSAPPTRPPEQEVLGFLAKAFGTSLIGAFMDLFPRLILDQVDKYLEEHAGRELASVYYRTFPRPTGDRFRATFSEASVPIDDLGTTATTVFDHAARTTAYRYLVPFALRFVGASDHYISMHHGRDSGTFEAFVVKGVSKATEALRDIEDLLPGARPHWGQMHWFTVSAPTCYPASWAAWKAQYDLRNRTGLFNCPTSDLLSISHR